MVMKADPIFRAVETVLARPAGWQLNENHSSQETFIADETTADELTTRLPDWDPDRPPPLADDLPIILMTPQGRPLTQEIVLELSRHRRLALICGRYEGVDERVRSQLITDELSIGDYVLSGGELAAMVVVDAVTRTLPGALGFEHSAHQDSHSAGLDGLLEGPQYTRPPIFRGEAIPDVLVSGHHANVARWRREQALLRTLRRRPDLLERVDLSKQDRQTLHDHGWLDPTTGS
jgi:tRNA (guanine37-N1)-methyltransferase